MDNESTYETASASSVVAVDICNNNTNTNNQFNNDLGDHIVSELVFGCQITPTSDCFAGQTAIDTEVTTKIETKEIQMAEEKKEPTDELIKTQTEDDCRFELESLYRLKDSTKKLLCIIDELQSKSFTNGRPIPNAYSEHRDVDIPYLIACTATVSDLPESGPLKRLEEEIKKIDQINIENEDNDCSVYKRLARKCHCLNRSEFNDFMIHFNESVKYATSNLGEIIKNMRILKRFLYMGGGYTKNALIFLNEGLTRCLRSEKVEILQGCSHADICNVFDDESLVRVCISGPCKYTTFGDSATQNLAARVLYRISIVEEGRRYLNFNSKITNDIKSLLRSKQGKFDTDTLEFLNSTMNLLSPAIIPNINSTYYCKADEGVGNRILNSLTHFRTLMTLEEVFNNLDLLNKFSSTGKGKKELKSSYFTIFHILKRTLFEYDNSDMNVLVTSILNNLMSQSPSLEHDGFKSCTVIDTATEPPEVKHEVTQVESKKFKKMIKSRLYLHAKSNKSRPAFRRDSEASRIMKKKSSKALKKPDKCELNATTEGPVQNFESSRIMNKISSKAIKPDNCESNAPIEGSVQNFEPRRIMNNKSNKTLKKPDKCKSNAPIERSVQKLQSSRVKIKPWK